MNAKESLSADRIAEQAFGNIPIIDEGEDPQTVCAAALVAIAAELRAARLFANYLEGREGSRVREKAGVGQIEDVRGYGS